MLLQIYTTTYNRTNFNLNVPDGSYEVRVVDCIFTDTDEVKTNYLYSLLSDTWRIPYGATPNRLMFMSNANNHPAFEYKFISNLRGGYMDLSIIIPDAKQAEFSSLLLTLDIMPTNNPNLFFK